MEQIPLFNYLFYIVLVAKSGPSVFPIGDRAVSEAFGQSAEEIPSGCLS
jgi:hypothetical protein